ncbi:MAG TPA: hypothetical protein VGG85_10645 [Terracidiphilus sp.]
MTAAFLARIIVTAIAAGQGIMPVFIDLNRTHATNPLWTGHARFHLVQQVMTLLLASAVEVGLLWWTGSLPDERFYLAALLTATSLAGFLLAALARPLYGGTLRDPNGMPPLRIRTRRGVRELDVNVPIVSIAAVMLLAAVLLFWRTT